MGVLLKLRTLTFNTGVGFGLVEGNFNFGFTVETEPRVVQVSLGVVHFAFSDFELEIFE